MKIYEILILAAIGCLIISSAITMSVPFGLGKILDIIYSGDSITDPAASKQRLNQFTLILCGVFVIGGLANFGRVYLFNNACKFISITSNHQL
jgi:ATP-binding cassette, subfamily B (MDR/TAP), member 10